MSPAHKHLFRVLTREEELSGVAVTAAHITSANVITTFCPPPHLFVVYLTILTVTQAIYVE
jgi:hypothetical protein